MEFWGVEVKAGEVLKVKPEDDKLIHISQASLGEVKDVKGAKNVPLRFKINDKDFVFGFLGGEDKTQLMFDLVFEKEFELSHGWKNGSVCFLGYTADYPVSEEELSDISDSEDDMIEADENGHAKPKLGNLKPAKGAIAAAANKKTEQPGTVDEDDCDSDTDDSLSSDSDDDEDEDDSEEEKELPKVEPTKKRAAEPAQKNFAPAKKAKQDNKVAIPSKPAAGKAPAGGNKSKGQKPKSGGGNRGRKF